MVKECASCNDGAEYSSSTGECPKCGNFLRMKKSQAQFEDDFSDIYDNFLDSGSTGSKHTNSALYEDTANYQNTNATAEKVKIATIDKMKKKKVKKKHEVIEGQVHNFREEILPLKFFERWMNSLTKGVPFVKDGYVNTFQVYDQSRKGTEVVLYGKILRGKVADNNRVRVYGMRDNYGTLVAQGVENVDSKTIASVNSIMSAGIVRFISLFLLFFVISLVYFVYSFDWINFIDFIVAGAMNLVLQILMAVLPLILIVAFIWIGFKKIFR
ncbi:hypothetical protein [Bacillus sp. PS06]|uniref:hypothetical protein n=1 Tax=Bacillus sp. PS06 TaxID=2764176 RepID=UPI00177B9719|nr:hypothetical protein [Bacillus sp. PS06]MBD8070707.1 hypothetical protein [Bacillus sp. PS06]